jgi:hypothetical protein
VDEGKKRASKGARRRYLKSQASSSSSKNVFGYAPCEPPPKLMHFITIRSFNCQRSIRWLARLLETRTAAIIFSARYSFLCARFDLRPSLQPFVADRVGLRHHRRT